MSLNENTVGESWHSLEVAVDERGESGQPAPDGVTGGLQEQQYLWETRRPTGAQGGSQMEQPVVVIAVPYDGVAQGQNGKDRQAFESLVHTLLGYDKIPATLCFYTEGVRWLTHESPFVEQLKEICARGADIVACRASMAEGGLLGDLAVGRLDTPDRIDDLLLTAQHAMVV